jgi:excisionase family DNA binding protein
VTLREVLAQLAARRADYGRLRAHVEAAALLDDVIAILEGVDGREAAAGRDLTTREAAAVMGLDSRTVERYCRAGRLPGAFKTSGETGDWRVPSTAIDAFRTRAGTRNMIRA